MSKPHDSNEDAKRLAGEIERRERRWAESRTNTRKAEQAALDWAADAIKAQDGGNMETETGWASDEALAHWLTIRRMAEER